MIPTAGADWRSQVDRRPGSRSISRDSAAIGGGIVALKKSVWRAVRQVAQHPADVGEEAHVEHPVGLVEHEVLEAGQLRVRVPEVIEQPAGRRDDHVDAAAERVLLRAHADAAEHRRAGDRRVDRQRR